MSYVFVILTWFLVSALWGGIGTAIGPGVMMLVIGLIVAICGCLYSLGEKIFAYRIGLILAGLIILLSSLAITFLAFPSLMLSIADYLFVAAFIVIPCYLSLFILRAWVIKF